MEEKIKVSCSRCGATNHFPLESAGKTVVCGRCRSPLPQPGRVLEPTAEELAVLIQHSGLPILVDFHSPGCAPCHMMSPVVEALAGRRKGELMVLKVNVDERMEVAGRFGIQAVPTFCVFHRGVERGRMSGAQPETDFSLWVAGLV